MNIELVLRVATYLRHEHTWIQFFWYVTLCLLVSGSRRFESNTILRNFQNHSPTDRVTLQKT